MESPIRSNGAGIKVEEKSSPKGSQGIREVPVHVLIDGPYGGSSLDLGDYETVLLISGGSGITFTLGLLDDIVGRCIRKGRKNGEKTKRIELSWCIRSLGACSFFVYFFNCRWQSLDIGQLDSFSSALMDIATIVVSSATTPTPLSLHVSIYVTGSGNPDVVPPIPHCDVIALRPSVYQILLDVIDGSKDDASATGGSVPALISSHSKDPESDPVTQAIPIDDEDSDLSISQKLPYIKPGERLAVCGSGPASLTTEIANAVSRFQLSKKGRGLGLIGLHNEAFAL